MTLRCKPDQLAWVNKADKPSIFGMVVKTVRVDEESSHFYKEPMWEVTFPGVVVNAVGEVLVGWAYCADTELTPIAPPGLTEEITEELEVTL